MSLSPQRTDVLIIGGGIIGCSIAYFLRTQGIEVMVIEREEIAAEASSAAFGMLSPLGGLSGPAPFTDLILESWSLFATLIPALEAASGVDIQYQQIGCLHVALEADEVEPLRKLLQVGQARDIEMQWLTGDEARKLAPQLSPQVLLAVYIPEVGSIQAGAMTRAYAGAARRLGARFSEQTQATGITAHGARVMGVRIASGETIYCNHLVIAAGAWSAHCQQWLGVALPVSPVKGQILSLRQPEPPLKHVLSLGPSAALLKHGLGAGVGLIPKANGTICVGSTREWVGFDKSLSAGGVAALLNGALRLTPSLENAPIVNMWTGLRPWSADGYPILGRVPGWENVIVATGHGGIGFEASPMTGKTIADLVTTGQIPERLRAFGMERFSEP